MRFLVTGVNGQLGHEVVKRLIEEGYRQDQILATSLNIEDIQEKGEIINVVKMDITNQYEVERIITSYNPDVIYHCAAWTSVDAAENPQNKFKCYDVNVNGTKNIIRAAEGIDAKVVYFSTDYVFDGNKMNPYLTSDEVNPQSVYGLTKYEGELEANKYNKSFVIRTSWVFGINGKNFVKTMLSLSEKYDTLTVVHDQIGSPTYAKDLARVAYDLSKTNQYGTYHCTNQGICSWAEFAAYILKDTNTKVVPVSTEYYYKPQFEKAASEGKTLYIANRPKFSVLDKSKLSSIGIELPQDWKRATDEFISELKTLEDNKVFKR